MKAITSRGRLIDQGPFELGTTRNTLGTTPEGGVLLGPEGLILSGNNEETIRCRCNGGAHNRVREGNANAGQGKTGVKVFNCNGMVAVLDEEELLFLASEHANTFDADVDNQPVQDLALNEDNIFQANECDIFDSDVDDEPTAQSIFRANLSSRRAWFKYVENEIINEVHQANVIDSTSVDMGKTVMSCN
ncbi:hypothetical protein Tco_0152198 [Tanacetum coccineum]